MSARSTLIRRSAAVLVALLIAIAVVPVAASGRPPEDRAGIDSAASPAPTVVRTVVREEAVRVLPIALAGAALVIAIAGTGYAVARTATLREQLNAGH